MPSNVKVTGVSLPGELLDEIDTLAKADGRNRSNWVAVALTELIGIRKAIAAGARLVQLDECETPDCNAGHHHVLSEHQSIYTAMPGASTAWMTQ